MNTNIKHIWWDLDGTLYKTPPGFEKLKHQKRLKLYSGIVGKPITDELKKEYAKLYKEHGSHSAVFVVLGKDKGYWQREHQKINLISYLKPDPKTVAMFRKFEELPYQHSIFTNRKLDYIEKILKHLQIEHSLFTYFITIDDISHPKPHIEGFKKMIKLSNLESNQILFVGDRIETDILPARRVGLKTVLVWSKEKTIEADYTFPHVGDIISLFIRSSHN